MEPIVTHLELTAPDGLRPAAPVGGLALEAVTAKSPLIRELHVGIGAQYDWPGVSRSEEDWARWLAHPLRQYRLVRHGEVAVGIADFEPQPGGDVEITTFGLLPEHVGKRLGGYALTLVVCAAWEATPADDVPVRRVWLHTSTQDHPHALPNYLRRGFRSFRTSSMAG